MTDFRAAPSTRAVGPREITPDMRADADHAGRFLRLFGMIFTWVLIFTLGILTAMMARKGDFSPWLIGAGGVTASMLVYLWGVLLRRRALQVFRHGAEARAVITEVFQDYRVRMNKKHPWRIRYRYTADGIERVGTATYWTDHRPDGEVGDEVTALYIPGSPSRTVLWSRLGVPPSPERARVAVEQTPRTRVVQQPIAENDGETDAIAEEMALAEAAVQPARAAKIAGRPGDRDSDAKGSTDGTSRGR